MNNRKRKEAIRETFAFSGEMFESERNQQSGLRLKTTRMSRTCGLSRIGGNGYLCAMMLKPSRMRRCRGRSLLELRRITAAPSFSQARGVFFGTRGNESPKQVRYGGIRKHGLIASNDFMGAPCGEPSCSPFPKLRSFLHPHGAARPVGRVDGFDNSNLGAPAMTLHEAEGAPARAYPLGVSSLRAFFSRVSCGNIRLPRRMTGCRLGGLQKARRITAAPRLYARGFYFGAIPCMGSNAPARGIRYPGRITLDDFMMSAPGGEPSGSPLPCLRSANLPGVALLLAGECDSNNSKQGNPAMNLHVTEGAASRALNLGVCKLLNLINRLTGRAGGVRPRGSYPATGPGMRLPSIWDVNPELLELARAETNRAYASKEVRHA